ncbi:MAG TPA: hypothetical protein VNI01_13510, partial [Elusimicrobiota bacterium]|nr:hypothetical protein [Elusimicrobiota bacterium]
EPAQAVPAAPEKAAAPAPPAKGDAETESVLALLEDAAPRLSAPAADPAADLSKLFDLRVALEATDPPTAAWMEARSPDAVAWARGLITAAGDRYARTENGFSRLHGWEAPYLDPAGTRDGHVISLGSGPDAFRPVRDFPLAGHFHYVDILRGWGAGPGEVIFEFIRRVQHLAAGGRVRLVEPGFVAQARGLPIERPPQDFSRHDFGEDFWRGWVESGDFRKPLVLEAESGSPRAPPRRFYLHPLDYSQPELVEELLAGIPADRLVGMLLTGAPVPDDAALALLLDRLAASSGAFVAEVFPTPRFREFLQALRSRFELRRPPREPKEHPRLNQATVFVAR